MAYTRPHEDRLGTGGATDDVLTWTGTGTAEWAAPGAVYFEVDTVVEDQLQFAATFTTLYGHNGEEFLSLDGFAQIEASTGNDMYLGVNGGATGGTGHHDMYGGNGVIVPRLTSDPAGGDSTDGQIYYNTSTDKFRGRANSAWVDLN